MSRGLAIAAGIAKGLDRAATNLYNIGIQKQKLQQQNELFQLQKKKADLDIRHMELTDMDPEMIDAKKQYQKYQTLGAKTDYEKAVFSLAQAERAETRKAREMRAEMQGTLKASQLYEQFLAGKLPQNTDFSIKVGPATIGTQKRAPNKWEMLFGEDPGTAAPQPAAPSAAGGGLDINGTIKSLRDQGMGDDEIRSLMTKESLDPSEYGL